MNAGTVGQLRALLAIAERGSFSEAALDLGLSQSTVSHAIAELERALSGTLLTRGRHGAKLTPLGERVAAHARTVLGALEAMRQEAELERGTLSGVLRVATLRSAGTHLLPPILADLAARHPALEVRVLDTPHDSGLEDALHDGHADLSLLKLPLRSALLAWPIARDEYQAVFPRGRAPAELTWHDIASAPALVCHEECLRVIEPHLRKHGHTLRAPRQVREDSVILSMVGHGLGLSVMPRLAIEPQPANVETRSLPDPLWRTIAVAALPGRGSSPAVQAFLESARRVGAPA